jgi:arabinose-5-phosphate isomerase
MSANKIRIMRGIGSVLNAEITALKSLQKNAFSDIYDAVKMLSGRSGKIIVTGVGKSGFVAMKIAATLTSVGEPAFFIHPVDALHGDAGIISDGDVVMVISASGETQEIVKFVRFISKVASVKIIAITSSLASSLGRMSDVCVKLRMIKEGSPISHVPMASCTASLVAGDLITSGLISMSQKGEGSFSSHHPGGGIGLSFRKVEDFMLSGAGLPLLRTGTSLKRALVFITKKKIGTAGVIDRNSRLIGVVTDGDIRRFLIKYDSLAGVVVDDIMNKHPKSIQAGSNLKEALEALENYKITSIFVKGTKGKAIGLVHIHDIVERNILAS